MGLLPFLANDTQQRSPPFFPMHSAPPAAWFFSRMATASESLAVQCSGLYATLSPHSLADLSKFRTITNPAHIAARNFEYEALT